MRSPALAAALAAAVSAALALPAAAPAEPVGPGQMILIRKNVIFQLEAKTRREPVGLKLKCEERNSLAQQCRGSWHNKRYAYEGWIFSFDDGTGTLDIAFAGMRTDRACAKKKQGLAKRACTAPYIL